MKERVLKICSGTWENASRDKRELSAYKELGADVFVLAKGDEKDKGRVDTVDGFTVYRYSTKPLGKKMPAVINRIVSVFTWVRFAASLEPTVITGHDLIGAYFGYLACKLRKGTKLIYDSHEYELGRNVGKKRSRLLLWAIRLLEKKVILKSAYTIVVCNSISELLSEEYPLVKKPVVIRSTPSRWNIDANKTESIKKKFLSEMNEVDKLVMFHGNLGRGNGINDIIKAVSGLKSVGCVLMGSQNDSVYVNELKTLIEDLGMGERVRFYPAVAIEELVNYVAAVDLELMPIEAITKSHFCCLPNKLFESIQAEVPIISSDIPEMKAIVEGYKIGDCCAQNSPDELREKIVKILYDQELYSEYKKNILKAKEELCWEKESQILKKAFSDMVSLR